MIEVHQDIADRHEIFWDLIKRFVEKLQPQPNGCLEWMGAETKKGYGNFWIHERFPTPFGQNARAHRFAYWLRHGAIDPDETIDHTCHNKLCCNPDHLQEVTWSENSAEANHYRWHGEALQGVDDGWLEEDAPGVF